MSDLISTSVFDVNDDWGVVWQERLDVNDDGRMDLVIYSNSVRAWSADPINPVVQPEAALRIYTQNADCSLTDATSSLIRNPISTIMGFDLSLGDLNGDGRIDFVLAGSGWDPSFDSETGPPDYDQGEPDVVYLSQSDGTWLASNPVAINVWSHNVAVGDLNGDGRDDFFSSSIETGNNLVVAADADRSFLSLAQPDGSFLRDQARLPDVLTHPNQIFVEFSEISYVNDDGETMYSGTNFTGSAIFDANGDGHNDLVALADGGTRANLLFLNDGTGSFAGQTGTELPAQSFGYGGFTRDETAEYPIYKDGTIGLEGNAADVDRDGDLDLIILSTYDVTRPSGTILSYAGTGIQVLRNDGSGNFSSAQNILLAEGVNRTYLNDIDLYDINRDGWIDIVAQGTHYDEDHYRTEIFINDGGTFSNRTADYIDDKTKQYFPFHQDGELHFFSYRVDWVSSHPVDGEANANAILQTLRSDVSSGTTIGGRSEAEFLLGSEGADTFLMSGGRDEIDGRGGLDVVQVSAARTSVAISANTDGSFTLASGIASSTLVNVERVQVTGGTIALDLDGNAGQTYRLYKAAFNRTPDEAGLSHNVTLMDGGLSIFDMASAFIGSAEFRQTYGENVDDTTFITLLYGNVLGRSPDEAGLTGWREQLSSGTASREQVLFGFSESSENKQAVLGAIGDGIWLV